MTAPDLDALTRLVAAMTPGPWRPEHGQSEYIQHAYAESLKVTGVEHVAMLTVPDPTDADPSGYLVVAFTGNGPTSDANTLAIANVMNAAEWLIQRARDAEDAEKYKAHIRTCGECIDCYSESQPHPVLARDQLVGDLDDAEYVARAERAEAERDDARAELKESERSGHALANEALEFNNSMVTKYERAEEKVAKIAALYDGWMDGTQRRGGVWDFVAAIGDVLGRRG